MVQKVITFVLITGIVNAVLYQEELAEIPDHLSDQKGCYIKDLGIVIPFNTVLPRPGCMMVECTSQVLVYTKCDIPKITDPRCKIVDKKKGLMYPQCCPQVKCV